MTVYAFGLEVHSYFNAGGHKSDLYYYSLGGRLLGTLDNTGKTTFYIDWFDPTTNPNIPEELLDEW